MLDWIIGLDESLFFYINNQGATPVTDGIMTLLSVAGDFPVIVLFGILFIILYEKKKPTPRMIAFVVALLLGGGVMLSVKFVVDRDRPLQQFKQAQAAGEVRINAPYNQLFHRSFPSGHSQAAFTVATFFTLYYRRFALLLLGTAAMVAISRVFLGVHYPLDVLVGSSIGTGGSYVVWKADHVWEGKKPWQTAIQRGVLK
jgi:undecaprenyl-diphosphatase